MHATMRCATAICSLFPFGQVFYRDGNPATTASRHTLIVDILVAIPRMWQRMVVEGNVQASHRRAQIDSCWPGHCRQIAYLQSAASDGFVLRMSNRIRPSRSGSGVHYRKQAVRRGTPEVIVRDGNVASSKRMEGRSRCIRVEAPRLSQGIGIGTKPWAGGGAVCPCTKAL